MTRHGIVIPLPGVSPPPECGGGPAFCAVCNAEMIELEALAIRASMWIERRRHRERNESFDENEMTAIWLRSGHSRAVYRRQAARLIRLREEDEGSPRIDRPRAQRFILAEKRRQGAKALGLTVRSYRMRRHYLAAKMIGLTTRQFAALPKDERKALLTSLKIPLI